MPKQDLGKYHGKLSTVQAKLEDLKSRRSQAEYEEGSLDQRILELNRSLAEEERKFADTEKKIDELTKTATESTQSDSERVDLYELKLKRRLGQRTLSEIQLELQRLKQNRAIIVPKIDELKEEEEEMRGYVESIKTLLASSSGHKKVPIFN